MRWPRKKTFLQDFEGAERVIQKFLWWPRCFDKEWRWLENAPIVEKVCKVDVGGSMEWGNYAWKWCEVRFENDHPLQL